MTGCEPVAEILPHHDAILALLKAAAPGPPPDAYLGVYDGKVTDDPPPADELGEVYAYCVLYSTPGEDRDHNAVGHATTFLYSFDVTAVGPDQRACLWAIDQIRRALIGQRLCIPGRDSAFVHAGPAARALRRADQHSPNRHVAALTFAVVTA